MSLRTPLSRVRGHGSAKEGAHLWIAQRATAIALVPLGLFLVASVMATIGIPYEAARAYLAQPLVSISLVLFVIASLWHARIGLGEVVADYASSDRTRVLLLLLFNFLAFGLGAACLLAVLRIYFAG